MRLPFLSVILCRRFRFKTKLPRYDAVLDVRREAVPRLYYAVRFSRIESVGEPDAEGWVEVAIRFQVEDEAAEFALSFGPLVEVLSPPALRKKVIGLAESVLAFYAQRPAPATDD